MPIYKRFWVLEVARDIKASLRLEVSLTRGEVPNLEQKVRRLQQRLQQKQKQLSASRSRRGPKRQLQQRLQQKQKQLPASRSRRGPKTHITVGDARDHYIGRVVRGKSFADVGGLYDTVGEKVSVAHSFGATTLTMIATVPQDDKLWQSFSDRMRYFGVSEFATISEDISGLINAPDYPRYDVVHCSIVHRVPNPAQFLSALHRITREYLVLGSAVTATRANDREETLEVPPAASRSVQALRDREGGILEDHRWPLIVDDTANPTSEETSWRANDFVSWRGLPAVDSLKAVCTSVGFNYEDGGYYEDDAYVMLLSR